MDKRDRRCKLDTLVNVTEGVMLVARKHVVKGDKGTIYAHRIIQGGKEIDVLQIQKDKEIKDGK